MLDKPKKMCYNKDIKRGDKMKEQLKGVEALEGVLTDLFKKFGISSLKLGTFYAYFHISEKVFFKVTYDKDDECFDNYMVNRFHLKDYSPFIFALLHEVGHYMTMDTIPEKIQNRIDRRKEWMTRFIKIKFLPKCLYKKIQHNYFNLYDEMKATKWAVWYWHTHTKEVEDLKRKAHFALRQFYKVNGVIA